MKTLIISIVALFLSAISFGQDIEFENSKRFDANPYTQIYSINWQSNLPLGATRNHISDMSFNGANIYFTYCFTDNLAIGIDFSWSYSQKYSPNTTYLINENTAFHGTVVKKSQMFPIKAQFKYIITPESFAKLFVSAGIGALSYTKTLRIQDYDIWDNTWGFLMSPEIGVLIPFGKSASWGAGITAGYNWATNKVQGLYFNVGLYFAVQ